MVKRLLLLCFFICSVVQLKSQIYGNEWINYTQQYYRISISKTGLYRLDSATLSNSGIPISTISPKNIQLFSKGQELYLYIKGESDNVLNTTDYIEFYAEKNDGKFDSLAYNTTQRLPNPYVALFNDTNYVYVTWNNSTTNKRMNLQTDVNFTGYTAANYIYNEKIYSGTSTYSVGKKFISNTIIDPRYIECEGYGTNLAQGALIQPTFGNLNIYSSTNLPVYLKANYSGSSEDYTTVGYDHNITFEYLNNISGYTTLNDTSFYGYQQVYLEKQVPSNLFNINSTLKISSVNSPFFNGITNSTNLHYISIKYPQIPDLSNQSEQVFFVDDNLSAPKTFLDLQNVNVGSGNIILYDLSSHSYFTTVVNSNNVKVLIPNSASQKKCFITNSSNVTTINSLLTPVNQTGFFVDYTTSITDSAFLIVSHKGLQTSANNYKTYRQSFAGGNNQVILSFIDELYDQFAYGNQKNPLAIKNFCRFLSDNLPKPPKYLLLLGKSIRNDIVRTNPIYWNGNYLPTMGIPASDNLFTTGIHGANSITPFIPVGRISAKTDQQVDWYLDKVKAHESSLNSLGEKEDWHKRVLHFAGGGNLGQQQQFESYINSYADIIEDTLFGGKVFTFKKTSTAPIQITVSDSVKDLINYGTSIITFFGHGSVTGFDQAIDDPNTYNNIGKYPLFIANSCYSGDIHEPAGNSTSESFTMIDKKGSIGFIASSSTGLDNTLNLYSTELYHSLAYDRYYKGIGDAVKNSCFKNALFNDPLVDITCLEMTVEGDPSIRLNAYSKPDYEIKNTSVYFNTTTYVDSIGINVKIRNLGKAIKDTFIVRIERYFANGDSVSFNKTIKAPYNSDTLSFFIKKDVVNGIGLNHFKVYIDAFNKIPEELETNNSTTGTVDLFISGGDVVPVYPYKYAIIPNTPTVTLKASTSDPFYVSANYRIQLDTNDTFINPINSTTVTSIGGIIEWNVNLTLPDSTVYFWRITRDSITAADHLNWRESSFQAVGTKTGWAQAHFHQFKNDSYQFVKYKKASRLFAFQNDIKSLQCNDANIGYVSFDHINYQINNTLVDYWTCSPGGGWSFAVFDSITALPWVTSAPTYTIPGNFNNCVCYNYPLVSVSFGATNYCNFPGYNWKTEMETFLNSIPPNNKVLAWSIGPYHNSTYSNSLHQQFESFGASSIRTIQDTLPYIIFGTKGGAIGSAHEVMGTLKSSIIRLDDTLKTKWNSGYVASEIIGPSTKWRSLHWKQKPIELPNNDSIVLQVIGIKANGVRDTLIKFNSLTTDILDLYNYADASIYPNLQLVARMKDNVNLTPPQLKKWQVIYDEVPECAINTKKVYTTTNDTMQEGADFIVHLPIENIGVLPFTDSLLITYWIEDKDRITHPLPQKLKIPPFASAQVLIDTIQLSSYKYPGLNYLWVDVNPPAATKYQLEQYHFNNIARIPFMVNSDKTNPLLDVTFDGTHILNGDVISAKPHVLITLKDENKFLALNDTSNFAVYIKYPNQASEKRLYFTNGLFFTPAQLPSNSCKIEWKPEFAIDGKYTLRVQATDRSKNVSGSIDYTIQFEVVTKQTITEVLNYPNPFSTSTKFVFTLTGSEIPDIFIIQIMTITGKVVREITKNELGNIHIGRNITDYAWDGKDEYGDKLGNGVYLYRVITRSNGQAIEKNATDADSFFKKGIGKLVIMR